MDFESSVQPFLRIFYFSGLSSLDSTQISVSLSHRKIALKLLFLTILFALIILSFGCFYYDIIYSEQRKSSFSANKPGEIYLFFNALVVVIILLKMICLREKPLKVFNKVNEIKFIANKKLKYPINFNLFRNKMFHHSIKILFSSFMTVMVMMTFQSRIHSNIFDYAIIFLSLVKGILLLHIIFLAEILNHLLEHIREWLQMKSKSFRRYLVDEKYLRKMQKCVFNQSDHINEYLQLKLVHFKVFEISTKISKYFGWNYLLIIFIDWIFLNITIYAIFIIVVHYGGDKSVIRM